MYIRTEVRFPCPGSEKCWGVINFVFFVTLFERFGWEIDRGSVTPPDERNLTMAQHRSTSTTLQPRYRKQVRSELRHFPTTRISATAHREENERLRLIPNSVPILHGSLLPAADFSWRGRNCDFWNAGSALINSLMRNSSVTGGVILQEKINWRLKGTSRDRDWH